ncbi:MAG: GNAT family N-acetyltransferase [Flavobacteriaceae bacterium]
MKYKIEQCTKADLQTIFKRYEEATLLQKEKKIIGVWSKFDRALIEGEIEEGRQWKIVFGPHIVCVWAITYSDPLIWGERDRDPSIYIHRIATHENFRGQQMVQKIVKWAIARAKIEKKAFIRLDTVGENKALIAHYKNMGFSFLGMFSLSNTQGLPAHYDLAPTCLFEIALN